MGPSRICRLSVSLSVCPVSPEIVNEVYRAFNFDVQVPLGCVT